MARYFDGANDYVGKTAPIANLPTGSTARTVLAWIRPTDYNTHFVIASWGELGNNKMSAFSVEKDTGHLVVAFYANDHISTQDIATGAWSFVGFTHDGSTTSKLYLNGALVSTKSDHAAINTTASDIMAGQHPWGGATSWAKGSIAMLMGWKVALSLNEIIGAQYGIMPRPANMFLYWPLWGIASPEPDLSGNLNNGDVSGAVLANHAPVGQYVLPQPRWRVTWTPAAEYINVTDSAVGTDTILDITEWLSITDVSVGTDTAYVLGEVLIDGLRLDHCLRIRVSEPTNMASKPVSSGLPTRIYLGKQGRTLEIEGWIPTVAELNVLSALADGAAHEVQLPTGSRVSVHIPDVNPIRPIEPGKYPYTMRAVERMD